jgi:hypothetical protein
VGPDYFLSNKESLMTTATIPELEVLINDNEMLVLFPAGSFPPPPPGWPKPQLGIGIANDRVGIFTLSADADSEKAECCGYLPSEGYDHYLATEKMLCAEVDPATGDIKDYGYFRPNDLIGHHISSE